jgi:hypothetical protein
MPYTFGKEKNGSFLVVEGSRAEWKPRPIQIKSWKVGFFDELPMRGHKPILANAFIVEDVDYRWARGKMIYPKIL